MSTSQDLAHQAWSHHPQSSYEEDIRDQPSHTPNPPLRIPMEREPSDDWGYFVDCEIPRYETPTRLLSKQHGFVVPRISEQKEMVLDF